MPAKYLVGARVIHISHGKGTIVAYKERPEQTTDIIEVDFAGKTLKFNYPTAFEKYISLDEEDYLTLSDVVEKDLKSLKASQKADSSATGKNTCRHSQIFGTTRASTKSNTGNHTTAGQARATNSTAGGKHNDERSHMFKESSRPNLYNGINLEGTPAWFREFADKDYYRKFQEDHAHYRKMFIDQYAPDILSKMDGEELLRKVFGTSGSMLYDLTQNKEDYWRFGSCGQYKYLWVVYHTEEGSWTYKRGSHSHAVSKEEAARRAVEVRDLLLRAVDIIRKSPVPDIISDYKFLENSLSNIFFYSYPWALKYYQMLFPDRFPCMYADRTLERALQILSLPNHGSRYLNLGEVALFTAKCGIDNSIFSTIYGDRWGWEETRSQCAGAKQNWDESRISVTKYRNLYL